MKWCFVFLALFMNTRPRSQKTLIIIIIAYVLNKPYAKAIISHASIYTIYTYKHPILWWANCSQASYMYILPVLDTENKQQSLKPAPGLFHSLCIHVCLWSNLHNATTIHSILTNNGVCMWCGWVVLRYQGNHDTSTPTITQELRKIKVENVR